MKSNQGEESESKKAVSEEQGSVIFYVSFAVFTLYLQFLLLFFTFHLALGQDLGRLLFDHLRALRLKGVKLGLIGQLGYPAVSAQLELTKP